MTMTPKEALNDFHRKIKENDPETMKFIDNYLKEIDEANRECIKRHENALAEDGWVKQEDGTWMIVGQGPYATIKFNKDGTMLVDGSPILLRSGFEAMAKSDEVEDE